MSTWTDETHEKARSIGFGFSFYEPGICELVADAVTEIERLRAVLDEMERMRSTLNLVINAEAGA